MAEKPSVLRETDDAARRLARTLLRSARFGTIAVLDPQTGYPYASRVLLANAPDGTPAILVSALSAHTRALEADPRSSLLTGEPGKGDPLAHARLTVQTDARSVDRGGRIHGWLRGRFLRRHPKAELYIDFSDFRFVLLKPVTASLNAGFGRAYALTASDLVMRPSDHERMADEEASILAALNQAEPELPAEIANTFFKHWRGKWHFSAIDAEGFEISSGDILHRVEVAFQKVSLTHIIADIRRAAYSRT